MLSLFIVSLVAAASAEVVTHDGPCPDVKPIENFNLTAYQGTWYEISKLPSESETGGKCGAAEYTLEGDVVKVRNTHVIDGVQAYIDGTAKLAEDANNSGKVVVTFKFGDLLRDASLTVLETDYTGYAIAYTCKYDDKKKTHKEYAWILSRSKKLEGDAKTTVDTYLKENLKHIDPSRFIVSDFSEEACKFTSTSLITTPPIVPEKH